MRYQKILVAIDRSPQTEVVFQQALELAKHEGASLMIFHCLSFESQGIGAYGDLYGRELANFSNEMQSRLKQENQGIRNWLNSYQQRATDQGIPTEWQWVIGDPGSGIRELAKTWGADLIVLGRRGRQGLAEIVLGSVSNYVIHHAPCSVLVVQGIPPEELNQEKSE